MKQLKKILKIILPIVVVLTLVNLMAFDSKEIIKIVEPTPTEQVMLEKIASLEEELRLKNITHKKEMYLKDIINYVEVESEIIIPDHFDTKYIEYIFNTASQLEIPIRVAFRLIYTESRFKDNLISPAGAEGLMQLMPETRSAYMKKLQLNTLNLDRNQEDIYIGLYYLNELHSFWMSRGNSYEYSWKLSLASYNAGKGKVLKYKGIPPYKETAAFVKFIFKSHSNPKLSTNYGKKYESLFKPTT